jgi:hypothetical protein
MDSKKVWGPVMWRILHNMAIQYPDSPTYANACNMYQRIWDFVDKIPCSDCRKNATKYIVDNPPNLYDSEKLQRWVWQFHNDVNKRVGNRQVTYDEYKTLYNAYKK